MREYIRHRLSESLQKCNFKVDEITIEKPKNPKFGDYTTNAALMIANRAGLKPREAAEKIIENLNYDIKLIDKIEIAGHGFINFYISDSYYFWVLNEILKKKEKYGLSEINKGKRANVEWVSANPTKPLHAGHGRHICLGKSISNLLEWSGYKVIREYYYNDAGNQMKVLAESVYARYMQIMEPGFPFPENGYHGNYITEIAKIIYEKEKEKYRNNYNESYFKSEAENYNFKSIKNTLEKLGIRHDVFFNESDLYKNGNIENVLKEFKKRNLSYISDDAVWLKIDESGERDKVIVKSSGEPTYRLPDIAYHIEKIKKGYDLIVDIFGSDHLDTYKDVLHGAAALGYDIKNIRVIIHQMVTFKVKKESNGMNEEVKHTTKMSGRSGKTYLLDDLIDEIGADATQFFFIMRSAPAHLVFDIDLAKEHSEKNPVYYLQYAHARICSIIRNAKDNFKTEYEKFLNPENIKPDEHLKTKEEIDLIRIISDFPEVILNAANEYEPHILISYLNQVAEKYHIFYHNHRVLNNEEINLSVSRLLLCFAVKQVLKNGFDALGISAPESM